MRRKWSLIGISLILVSVFFLGGRETARQWLTVQAQNSAQQDLLNAIAEIRHALLRFYHLPYLLNNNPDVVALTLGDRSITAEVEGVLSQLDKAANTKGWYILSDQGKVLASSVNGDYITNQDLDAIVHDVHALGEGTSMVRKTKGVSPFYYLSSPIFSGLNIVGIVVVQLDLRLLTDQWLASSDIMLLQNPEGQFFLSSSDKFSADALNDGEIDIKTKVSSLWQGDIIRVWQLGRTHYFAQTIQLDDLKWKLSYLTPISAVETNAAAAGWSVAMLLLLLFMLGVISYQRRQKNLSQRRIQALIEESEHKLNQMINKTQVGLLLLDEKGRVVDINAMAISMFGFDSESTSDIKISQLIEGRHSPIVSLFDQYKNVIEDININAQESLAVRKDGSTFPALVSLTAFPFHGRHFYLVTLLDITKRKKAEEALFEANTLLAQRVEERTKELHEAQAQLIESSKMAAMGRMSSAIAHELNQPLTGLRTLVTTNGVLFDRGEGDKILSNNLLIDKLIERMVDMTTQLKTFAYSKPDKLDAIALPAVLEEVLRIYQQPLERVNVRIRLPENTPCILAEEQRLRQVLGNLISNACDAMANTLQPHLIISVIPEVPSITVTVSDNGIGVEEEAMETLFEPFTTSKKIGKGLGLGLSICANNMRDMEGSIAARKNKDGGMDFDLIFQLGKDKRDE
ncbi:sensor histidine kinase [Grimontia sp. NTOU-MAR1]|uniref:sensor histidine kinase n=1 Tax=Grimontia sp. NTOU-MAR1 TaxID=3111011 RepID=UPI002DB645DA|nr:ATP-binding protein [Grimontia sp. NTOU-MAR1]WRW00535.1 ATP-binding protein [Grimontia sp. NTOU-MAR1]